MGGTLPTPVQVSWPTIEALGLPVDREGMPFRLANHGSHTDAQRPAWRQWLALLLG